MLSEKNLKIDYNFLKVLIPHMSKLQLDNI
jgi:hypothetical protein